MVTGGDSCSRGLGSNLSTGYLIDIFHICCKNCIICSKRWKIYEKQAGVQIWQNFAAVAQFLKSWATFLEFIFNFWQKCFAVGQVFIIVTYFKIT